MGHRSYVLLVLGFFTCGFQLAFITVHMPAYLIDRGLSAQVGGWTIAVIGLFNIVGSLASGWLGTLMPKRYLLSFIYFARAAAVFGFIIFPVTPFSSILFGAVMGLLWLSTVPPTNGIIALIFGTRWLATLAGLAFFSHQVGGFLGVWLGGVAFVRTGSNDVVLVSELADGSDAVAMGMAVAASGALSKIETVRAWTPSEFKGVAEKAARFASAYAPPGK